MATFKSFEEIEAWKKARILTREVYSITNTREFARDFGLKDQIRRAAVSVPSNISEGFDRDSKNQFVYFLVIAKGSCGELRTQLKIARILNYLNEEKYITINDKCISVSKQLAGFITYLKSHKNKI